MKKQNQTSEAAKKAAREILEQVNYYSDMMHTAEGERTITEIIQRHFDAATAEVKKEEKEKSFGSETPATRDVQREETDDVIREARVMCEQYQLLFSIVSDISGFKDVDWEQDDHEKAIRDFSRALAKLDAPTDSSKEKENAVAASCAVKEENL